MTIAWIETQYRYIRPILWSPRLFQFSGWTAVSVSSARRLGLSRDSTGAKGRKGEFKPRVSQKLISLAALARRWRWRRRWRRRTKSRRRRRWYSRTYARTHLFPLPNSRLAVGFAGILPMCRKLGVLLSLSSQRSLLPRVSTQVPSALVTKSLLVRNPLALFVIAIPRFSASFFFLFFSAWFLRLPLVPIPIQIPRTGGMKGKRFSISTSNSI